jgi:hypothetical protein
MTLSKINKTIQSNIPKYALDTVITLKNKGFKAFLVGGCVRDLFIDRVPKDWDVTTDATPEEIIAIFPHTFYENTFGTVGVVYGNEADKGNAGSGTKTENGTENDREGNDTEIKHNVKDSGEGNGTEIKDNSAKQEIVVEVTPFRKEGIYSDKRRPDSVEFSKNIEDDLLRRDFTMNAVAFDPITETVVDPYNGIKDTEDRVIRAVGDAKSTAFMVKSLLNRSSSIFLLNSTLWSALVTINSLFSERCHLNNNFLFCTVVFDFSTISFATIFHVMLNFSIISLTIVFCAILGFGTTPRISLISFISINYTHSAKGVFIKCMRKNSYNFFRCSICGNIPILRYPINK